MLTAVLLTLTVHAGLYREKCAPPQLRPTSITLDGQAVQPGTYSKGSTIARVTRHRQVCVQAATLSWEPVTIRVRVVGRAVHSAG